MIIIAYDCQGRVHPDNVQAEPDRPNRKWAHGLIDCRACGHRQRSVWPTDIAEDFTMECAACGHPAAEPIAND
jgi:Zn ribbon nucleic-acid-binding protein